MAPASIGHGDFGLTPLSVRVERSRDTHRARATAMGVPTSLDTNGPNRSHHAPTTSVGTEHARDPGRRSEEHTSELQSLMRISYAVFCLKKKNRKKIHSTTHKSIQTTINIQHVYRVTDQNITEDVSS